MKTCIYTISHPLTNEIVYVGKTKNLAARAKQHVNGKHGITFDWIQLVLSVGLKPVFTVVEVCVYNAHVREKEWIVKIANAGSSLLNKRHNPVYERQQLELNTKFTIIDTLTS